MRGNGLCLQSGTTSLGTEKSSANVDDDLDGDGDGDDDSYGGDACDVGNVVVDNGIGNGDGVGDVDDVDGRKACESVGVDFVW